MADPNAQPGYGSTYAEPPPPPAPPPEEARTIPPFSVRIDPFNWILLGRLGFELEVGLAKWISVETVPMFVTTETPPLLNYGSFDVHLAQRSNGWGPLAGATLGVNFWLSGKSLKGYRIGVGLTNYGVEYESKDDDGDRFDSVAHTERQLYFMFGSAERWGAFTIAGGLGFGYELNKETRCFESGFSDAPAVVPGDCGHLQLKVPDPDNPNTRIATLNVSPFTYPWEILARFSLGVTID